jgi:hypothetical protein
MALNSSLYSRTPLFIIIMHMLCTVMIILIIQAVFDSAEIKLNDTYIKNKLASSKVKFDESKDTQGFLTSQTNTIQYAKNNLNRKVEGETVYDFSTLESSKENPDYEYIPQNLTRKKSNLQLWFSCVFQQEVNSCFKVN